ncbi:hypothetical protein G6F57_015923 [Rhizopus arrhizus]|nr:hypothetical protein G6F57_015923 [Rhizopus arrhizus]
MSFSISQNLAAQPRCAEQSAAACAGNTPNRAHAAAAAVRDLIKEGMRCLPSMALHITGNGSPDQRAGQRGRHQQRAQPEVGAEQHEIAVGALDVEHLQLPRQMHRNGGHADLIRPRQAHGVAAPGPQQDGGNVEAADPQLALVAKAHGGRMQPPAAVVAHVDVGVDAVVAHLPEHRAEPHGHGGQRHVVLRVGPGHQHAPVKADAQHHLRPVGDALAQRVDEDEGQYGHSQPAAHFVQEEQQRTADHQLAQQEPHGVVHRQLAAGQRAKARAFDVLVEVAVAHVVDRAAAATHQQGAQREDEQPLQVRQAARALDERGDGRQQAATIWAASARPSR